MTWVVLGPRWVSLWRKCDEWDPDMLRIVKMDEIVVIYMRLSASSVPLYPSFPSLPSQPSVTHFLGSSRGLILGNILPFKKSQCFCYHHCSAPAGSSNTRSIPNGLSIIQTVTHKPQMVLFVSSLALQKH